MKAVILDRDGVINKCMPPHQYVAELFEIKYLNQNINIFNKIKKNIPIFIVTNQQGVGKRLMSEKKLDLINNAIIKHLEKLNVSITQIYSCIHLESDNCNCRKPKPEMLLKLAREYKINLKDSVFIGDSESDIMCANNAKCKSIYIGNKKINSKSTYVAKNSKELLNILKKNNFIDDYSC